MNVFSEEVKISEGKKKQWKRKKRKQKKLEEEEENNMWQNQQAEWTRKYENRCDNVLIKFQISCLSRKVKGIPQQQPRYENKVVWFIGWDALQTLRHVSAVSQSQQ